MRRPVLVVRARSRSPRSPPSRSAEEGPLVGDEPHARWPARATCRPPPPGRRRTRGALVARWPGAWRRTVAAASVCAVCVRAPSRFGGDGCARARPGRPHQARPRPTSRRRGGPESWLPERPGEMVDEGQPRGDRLGHQGPDQGYALPLARRFEGKLTLTPGEHEKDALAGAVAVALEAGLALRSGAGHPRPHRRPHRVGLPRRGARQGAGRPAQAPLRGGVAPAPLRGAAPHRRPGPGGDAAADPRVRRPRRTGTDWRSLLGDLPVAAH